MTQPPIDIDRLVREVLAELKPAPANKESSTSNENTTSILQPQPAAKSPQPMPSSNGELVLSTRLVSMSDIAGKLAGISRVVVDRRAVVTPAVCDALHEGNITLSRALPTPKPATTTLRLVVVAARTKADPKPLANTLQSKGFKVECHATDCLLAATDQLAVS